MEGGYGDVNLKPNEVGTMRKHYEVVSARAYERLTTSAKFFFKPLYPLFINTMNDELKQYFSTLGKKGGKARAKNLSKEELHAIAMKGVEARKAKRNETFSLHVTP